MERNSEFWRNQSEQFDKSADYYDKYRPSYPEELVDCIINETGINTESRILEIGAGSGKATELFVKRNLNMYCIEPGESLAEAGRRKFSSTGLVEYCTCRLEEWEEIREHFDLAISAQAFHWVPKPIGFQKCSGALKPKGYIGLFWNLYVTCGDPIDDELDKTGMFFLQSEEACENRINNHIQEILESSCFREPKVFRFPWKQRYSAEEYIGFMKTGNQYLSASEENKKTAEERVRDIIKRGGGFIERPYLCVLFLAQKL